MAKLEEPGSLKDVVNFIDAEEPHQEQSVALTPLNIIQQAIASNVDVDKLEKLMDLEERWRKNKAKEAFDEAMMNFQSKCPIIKKTKAGGSTKGGQIAYYYAPLEDIVAQVKELLAENGFSYLIKTEFPEGKVRATCVARHRQGHSEETTMESPLMLKTGVMSDAQVVAATVTFNTRYAFKNAFGIMTGDEDLDAITEDTNAKLAQVLQQWDVKDHLVALSNGIGSNNALNQFIDSLPNIEQLTRFKEMLAIKIDKKYHPKLWNDFQRQLATSADDWLNKLSQQIKKE